MSMKPRLEVEIRTAVPNSNQIECAYRCHDVKDVMVIIGNAPVHISLDGGKLLVSGAIDDARVERVSADCPLVFLTPRQSKFCSCAGRPTRNYVHGSRCNYCGLPRR